MYIIRRWVNISYKGSKTFAIVEDKVRFFREKKFLSVFLLSRSSESRRALKVLGLKRQKRRLGLVVADKGSKRT